jgi:hypothetical protein
LTLSWKMLMLAKVSAKGATMTLEEATEELKKVILTNIFSNKGLVTPLYRADIKTEAQANAAKDLPFLYAWNEQTDKSGMVRISYSVNTRIIGSMLEQTVSRDDPLFDEIRDAIAETVRSVTYKAMMDTCIHAKVPPSILYSPQYRARLMGH